MQLFLLQQSFWTLGLAAHPAFFDRYFFMEIALPVVLFLPPLRF